MQRTVYYATTAYANNLNTYEPELKYHYLMCINSICVAPAIAHNFNLNVDSNVDSNINSISSKGLIKIIPFSNLINSEMNKDTDKELAQFSEDFDILKKEIPDIKLIGAKTFDDSRPEGEFQYVFHRCYCDKSKFSALCAKWVDDCYVICEEESTSDITIFVVTPVISEEYPPTKLHTFFEDFYEKSKLSVGSLKYVESYITCIAPKSYINDINRECRPEF